jgi:membrane protein
MPSLLPEIRWPTLFVCTTLAFAVIYRYGPCYRPPTWHLVTFGSVFATFVWLGASYLFSWYTSQFGSYNKTYGSLGAVIGFMTWIWISVMVILIGAELDAAIETQFPANPKKLPAKTSQAKP